APRRGKDGVARRAPDGGRRRARRADRSDAPRRAPGIRRPRGRHARPHGPDRVSRRAVVSTEIALAVSDLHVHLGESHILQGITFAVPKGRVTALLGRNGGGKTTTLRARVR